jgi:hypothetical protein
MHGDMKHGVQDRTPIFFIPLEIKSNTKQLLLRLKHFVLVRQGRTLVQYVPSVCGMP